MSLEDINEKLQVLLVRTSKIDHMYDLLTETKQRVDDLEGSQSFINKCYEEQKKEIENLKRINKIREDENAILLTKITNIENNMEQEKISRNTESQYHRTSLNVKICGNIPIQEGERDKLSPSNAATMAIIIQIVNAAEIIGFHESHVDVFHRLLYSNDTNSSTNTKEGYHNPIIIRFTSKRNRYLFYNQRSKLRNITIDSLDLEIPLNEENVSNKSIYMQESLTRMNSQLLRKAKEVAGGLQYKHKGYVIDGEVRVKIADNAKHIAIRSMSDIDKIQ